MNSMVGEGVVSSDRRSPWLRLVAALLVTALSLSFVPRPAAAAEHRCHAPAPQHVVMTTRDPCGQCAIGACAAMPGCGHLVAVTATVPPTPVFCPHVAHIQPGTRAMRDLATRGPPTPPPNS